MLAAGRFGEINVFNHIILLNALEEEHKRYIWLSWQSGKDGQTCMRRATNGRREEAPAGTRNLAIT